MQSSHKKQDRQMFNTSVFTEEQYAELFNEAVERQEEYKSYPPISENERLKKENEELKSELQKLHDETESLCKVLRKLNRSLEECEKDLEIAKRKLKLSIHFENIFTPAYIKHLREDPKQYDALLHKFASKGVN